MPVSDDEPVRNAIRTIRLVPDAHRRFVVELPEVARLHGISTELLDRLLDLGLPHRGSGDALRFDLWDLANLGLLLGLPSPRRVGMRWWGKAFREVGDERSGLVYSLRLSDSLTMPAPAAPLTLDPVVSSAAIAGTVSKASDTSFTVQAKLTESDQYIEPEFHALFDEGLRLRFHLVPRSLHEDPGFAAATGLADCQLAAQYLVNRAAEWGLQVRPAEGLFLARPYAFRHSWIEVREGERWITADPFFLQALAQWGVVDPVEWPAHRSPWAVLWRLGREYRALLRRGQMPVKATVAVLGSTGATDP